MPVPTTAIRLTEEDLARLDRIAEHYGFANRGHGYTGRPNRTEAIRRIIRDEADRIDRWEKNRKKGAEQY